MRASPVEGATSVTLWSITDGATLRTVQKAHHSLRLFYPAGGLLFYDDTMIDLFHLDLELLHLRQASLAAAETRLDAESTGHSWPFGASQAVHVLTEERLAARDDGWRNARADLGYPV